MGSHYGSLDGDRVIEGPSCPLLDLDLSETTATLGHDLETFKLYAVMVKKWMQHPMFVHLYTFHVD